MPNISQNEPQLTPETPQRSSTPASPNVTQEYAAVNNTGALQVRFQKNRRHNVCRRSGAGQQAKRACHCIGLYPKKQRKQRPSAEHPAKRAAAYVRNASWLKCFRRFQYNTGVRGCQQHRRAASSVPKKSTAQCMSSKRCRTASKARSPL